MDILGNIKYEKEENIELDIESINFSSKRCNRKSKRESDLNSVNKRLEYENNGKRVKVKKEDLDKEDKKQFIEPEKFLQKEKSKSLNLKIVSIESVDQVILDPIITDYTQSTKELNLKQNEQKMVQKPLFIPKPVKDIFDPDTVVPIQSKRGNAKRLETEALKLDSPKSKNYEAEKKVEQLSPTATHCLQRVDSSNTSKLHSSPPKTKLTSLRKSTITISPMQIQELNLKILKGFDLMCWQSKMNIKIRSNEKYQVAYENMITKFSLIALFKCMAKRCSFNTDDPNDFLIHLNYHDNVMKKKKLKIERKYALDIDNAKNQTEQEALKLEMNDEKRKLIDYFNCCSYCQFSKSKLDQLVHHINDVHRKDYFQCGMCFFRTCVGNTCLEHFKQSHHNKVPIIYECPGKNIYEIAMKKAGPRLNRKREINVAAFRCKICDLGFFPLKEFLQHCENFHKTPEERNKVEENLGVLENAFKIGAYGMFQCLYCVHGSHEESQILSHLLDHPNDLGFYCLRQPKESKNDPSFYQKIESTTIVEVKSNVEVIEFKESKEVLCMRNIKELIDQNFYTMLNRKSISN